MARKEFGWPPCAGARHLHRAIALSVHSGIATGWMVVLVFVDALFGLHNSQAIAIMFTAGMALFTLALVFFLPEVGLTDAGCRTGGCLSLSA